MTLYRLADGVGESAYSVVIRSTNGFLFDSPNSTLCECLVYYGTKEITPKSYNWLLIMDDDTEWQSIGTESSVRIGVSAARIRQRIKCQVEV